jgi:glycosyltransferase involved in cell wall biosynthesis
LSVVQLLPQLHSGGVERGTLEINRALVAAGHQSVVISGGGQMVAELESEGGRHVTMQVWKKSPATLATVRRLRRWIAEHPIDILHVRSRVPAWVTYLAWRRLPAATRPRLVSTVHGLNRPSRYSRIMTQGEAVIVVSETVRRHVLECYPDVDPNKIIVIHRGVDPAEFPYGYQPTSQWRSSWYQEFPQLRDQFVVCLAGRVTRLKGHFDLLQAIDRLRSGGVLVHGLIVGGEDPRRANYSEQLRSRIRDLNLESQVTFTGYRRDVRDILAIADVSLSATTEPPESFGRSVLESVRLGRITIGYAHGGVGEVLSRVYPAGCVPLGDTDALAARIKDAYDGLMQPPSESRDFLLSTMQHRTLELYQQICNPRHPLDLSFK